MKNYNDFSIEELVLDAYFRKWATNQLLTDDTFWDKIQNNNQSLSEKIQTAKAIITSLNIIEEDLTDEEVRKEVQKIYQVAVETQPTKLIPIYRQPWLRIAASVALIMGIGWFMTKKSSNPSTSISSIKESKNDELIELINDGETVAKYTLQDGSTVNLEKSSKLSYPKSFAADKRVVYLKGVAFFEIQKDAQRPFLVFTDKIVTKVLGTKFKVLAKENDKNISVSVKEGKVGVEKDSQQPKTLVNGVLLQKNQKVIFNKDRGTFFKINAYKSIKKNDFYLESFDFENTPLPKAFDELERAYGIRIIFEENKIKNCLISGKIPNDSFYKVLNTICKDQKIKSESFDGQILILSDGCR